MASTLIEHAIAIPTRQNNVWEHIRDIQKQPVWRTDSESIAFLTSKSSGRGTRWRSTLRDGKAHVVEITAWYEGLGYEYVVIDGSPFQSNRGRIRLQEVPEGTIVQWTFSYELSGFMSGIRNSLLVRRNIDNMIVDSLRNLYTYIKERRGVEAFTAEESSSYVKAAPDVEARANYQPRYPSVFQDTPAEETVDEPEPTLAQASVIPEPPIEQDDTKPNQVLQQTQISEPSPVPQATQEPTFLKDVPVQSSEASPPSETVQPETQPAQTTEADTLESSEEETEAIQTAQSEPETVTEVTKPVTETLPAEPEKTGKEPEPLPGLVVQDDLVDTSRISVFDVFGLPKPSETEQIRAIKLDEERPEAPTPDEAAAFMSGSPIQADIDPEKPRRSGLRAALRRKQTKIRRPK